MKPKRIQASKRERRIQDKKHRGAVQMSDRISQPLEEALAYLNEQPPRVTLARNCIKAALEPDEERWDDGGITG
jgi:hypothetical protein